ncbi:aminotransferase class I/II-fold pyridoxal phosphate-dependent enzyme [Anaerocolumna sedimenticola]|uniref:Aminotransferase class I/II-fold pyridoxal phosphate-dependent enzyme n=1 Tax=Anaerocolumna sedimenticola TaxID=2696063 RepID=A0A6P1TM51_9FIRM|nr:histidinol-phosphate transaminase [Anaerocolumna sedimenticola]QHQ61259.1 aminotransferase class I/II-fold pyridoxal phosphate-dependent enzyme [Anaerocolumna sedimenticola]
MEQYRHGGEVYDKKIRWDFSVNTNPLGLPEGVKKTLIEQVDTFTLYPDNRCSRLITAIADYEEVNRDTIICGNGASDIIFRLCYALKPKKAMVMAPSFSEYEKALTEAGGQITYCLLTEGEEFNVTELLLNQLDETIDLLFLCNPNNPVGNLISPPLLEKIMEQCLKYNIFLVMDECFIEFTDNMESYSIKKYIIDNDKIFLLKAFTKLYAMAGLRLGYGICSDLQLVNRMSAIGPAWNVSVPAQLAGIEALKEETYRLKTRDIIRAEREYLYNSLKILGIKVFKPTANYIFFKCRENLYEFMMARGILVRQCDNYNQLNKEYYRIAVKNHEENEILIKKITEFLERV